ncbi:4'-phosphopantetheinyl transferase superfamily protein [Candidatus Acetothermia bacterium]|nr:4'-phosphopantetheinyl transferase superfamily protein [Candidatus Acetothermia bacterium]MBI3459895.1 4'-phosphopantetheinyl transferase superfamily protein [Candidatus Acetothermia bacterium]
MNFEAIQTCLVTPHQLRQMLESEPLESWLTKSERSRLRSLRSPKRRTDWLTSRLAAKQLLRDYLNQTQNILVKLNEIEIYNEASDAPAFNIIHHSRFSIVDVNISIAHSHGHGICALSEIEQVGYVGVDIEKIRPLSRGVLRKFLNKEEMIRLSRQPISDLCENAIAYWTIKEAALKSLRANQSISLRDLRVSFKESGESSVSVADRRLQLIARYWQWKDFAIAIAHRSAAA